MIKSYKIYINEDIVFENTPFNLKNDLKEYGINCNEKFKQLIVQEIAAKLKAGFNSKDCIDLFTKKINGEIHIVLEEYFNELEKERK